MKTETAISQTLISRPGAPPHGDDLWDIQSTVTHVPLRCTMCKDIQQDTRGPKVWDYSVDKLYEQDTFERGSERNILACFVAPENHVNALDVTFTNRRRNEETSAPMSQERLSKLDERPIAGAKVFPEQRMFVGYKFFPIAVSDRRT